MNHFLFLLLLFLFVFLPLFAMALCLVEKRFPGDGVLLNQSGKTIRIARPTDGSEEVAGKNFAAIRQSILLKILAGVGTGKPKTPCDYSTREQELFRSDASHPFASPLLPTRMTQKPVGPRLTGLLICSGVLRRMG